jgi:hypothetical protein
MIPGRQTTTNGLSTGTAKREITVASSSRIFATVAKLQQAEAFMPRLRHKTLRNRRL